MEEKQQQILIVKLSSLGDVLHALPAVAELKRQLRGEIHWAVQPGFSTLVGCFSCVDKVIEVPRPGFNRAYSAALCQIRSTEYDMVVDFQGLLKSAIIARAARAPRRIGPSFAREGSKFFYHELAGSKNKNRHAIEECLDVISHLGLEMPSKPSFPMKVPDIDLDALMAELPYRGPLIAMAPCSRWESKNWPEEHFAELLGSIVRGHDVRVCFIGGRGDAETAQRIIDASGVKAVNFCGCHSIVESLGVLAKCDALVSNDSGPMHMAVALGVKSVVPFGSTLPERTGPYGPGHVPLRVAECRPCRKRVCPKGTKACIRDVTPAMVEAALFGAST